MNISLIYFNFPFWRAEVARVSLFIGNIDFKDIRISSEEFQRVKEKGQLDNGTLIPFHQLPCLIVDGEVLAQTAGIARFCGKLTNLYPSLDIEAARVDQYIDMASDITNIISMTKLEDRDSQFLKELKKKLFILNKSIVAESIFLVNNRLSIADIAIWSLICWFKSGKINNIPANFVDEFNNIIKICAIVDKNKKLNDWVKKTYPSGYNRDFN